MPGKSIDPEALARYNEGFEKGRLRQRLGLVEFARTCEILLEQLPAAPVGDAAPAVIYDIGGAYGEYSYWLAARGYEVHLFDLSETNIAMAAEQRREYPRPLAAMEVADARSIPRPDASADAILFMGPLYHIVEPDERLAALREAKRLMKPGGVIFAAAITPYAMLLWATTVFGHDNDLLMEPAFMEMVARQIQDGQHIPNPASSHRGMPRAFFHRPEQLAAELAEVGFVSPDVRGVVGPAWLAPDLDAQWGDPARREALLQTVRMTEREAPLMGLHTHLLAVARA